MTNRGKRDGDPGPAHDAHGSREGHEPSGGHATVILHVGGLYRGSETAVVGAVLGRRPGGVRVEADPVAQTATVTYDAGRTSVAEVRQWVEACGYHCAGQSVPTHVCDPMAEPDPPSRAHTAHAETAAPELPTTASRPSAQIYHAPSAEHAGHVSATEAVLRSPHEVMGHGGHAGMSMEAMVRQMRNRFLVAAFLSVPILLW